MVPGKSSLELVPPLAPCYAISVVHVFQALSPIFFIHSAHGRPSILYYLRVDPIYIMLLDHWKYPVIGLLAQL